MIIKPDEEKHEKWFTYEEGESFLLRFISRDFSTKHSDEEIARALFADWRGITDTKGNELPCTPEFIDELMKILEGRTRYAWALMKASNLNNFVDMERVIKNLSRPSNGESNSRTPRPATATSA